MEPIPAATLNVTLILIPFISRYIRRLKIMCKVSARKPYQIVFGCWGRGLSLKLEEVNLGLSLC